MNKLFMFLIIILFFSTIYAQDNDGLPTKEEWNFVRNTALELDSALTECQELNKLYEKRIVHFNSEVESYIKANQAADSIIAMKDEQLSKRKDQVSILRTENKKLKIEIWAYRGGGVLIILAGILLLK